MIGILQQISVGDSKSIEENKVLSKDITKKSIESNVDTESTKYNANGEPIVDYKLTMKVMKL